MLDGGRPMLAEQGLAEPVLAWLRTLVRALRHYILMPLLGWIVEVCLCWQPAKLPSQLPRNGDIFLARLQKSERTVYLHVNLGKPKVPK